MQLTARYFDGSSLEGHLVEVSLTASYVTVRSQSRHAVLPAIPASRLFELFRASDGRRVDLGVTDNKDIRLIIEGEGVAEFIDQILPGLKARAAAQNWRANTRLIGIAAAVLVGLIALFFQFERLAPTFVPLESEQEIGKNLADSFLSATSICEDPEGSQALAKLTDRLSPSGHLPIPLTVRVADSDTVNAFALPGGQIVLFKGLIQKATSPDEVAGVLAHEIGHVEHRHALRRLIRAAGVGFLTSMISGGVVSDFSQQLVVLDFSREMEEEADEAALLALTEAGVESQGFAAFFERLAEEETTEEENSFLGGVNFQNLLSTHPLSAERSERIRAHPKPKMSTAALGEADWQALRNICQKQTSEDDDS